MGIIPPFILNWIFTLDVYLTESALLNYPNFKTNRGGNNKIPQNLSNTFLQINITRVAINDPYNINIYNYKKHS
ncbi:hypothetical protein SSIL_2317 [Solibacillus silvestris StLB046]|uniref:Uncharacterized protein n=1 Tax=Solibacillus silvestris (strain StLB046) TaxID=1002809 RepID=F2FAH3_SOLSS|nr:hypothetical protein SSIL_2317 [Solibacillus silvestris StLB046]